MELSPGFDVAEGPVSMLQLFVNMPLISLCRTIYSIEGVQSKRWRIASTKCTAALHGPLLRSLAMRFLQNSTHQSFLALDTLYGIQVSCNAY
jgi:hypothetical protein